MTYPEDSRPMTEILGDMEMVSWRDENGNLTNPPDDFTTMDEWQSRGNPQPTQRMQVADSPAMLWKPELVRIMPATRSRNPLVVQPTFAKSEPAKPLDEDWGDHAPC